jgi:thiamine-monophosphate kinase
MISMGTVDGYATNPMSARRYRAERASSSQEVNPMGATPSGGSPRRLRDVGEDELLALLFPFFESGRRDRVAPGDDAAVVAVGGGSVVVTTDAMVRGQDWTDAWSAPEDVSRKALTQNLADVAAMGARPRSVLVTLLADPDTSLEWVVRFAQSLGDAAAAHDVSVAGGDLSSAPQGVLAVSMTALGDLQGLDPVLRSGACTGDVVAVAGTLGWSAAGLRLLQTTPRVASPEDVDALLRSAPDGIPARCIAHHLRPRAPVDQGPAAARAGATAMIDVSDGLLRDGHRLAAASGVRLGLDGAALREHIETLAPVVGPHAARESVLAGGEEHSLLATFPGPPPPGWRPLGHVAKGSGVTVDGVEEAPRGWDHFGG